MTGKSECVSTLTVQSADIDDTGVYSCLTSTAERRSKGSAPTRELRNQYNVFVFGKHTGIGQFELSVRAYNYPSIDTDAYNRPCRETAESRMHINLAYGFTRVIDVTLCFVHQSVTDGISRTFY